MARWLLLIALQTKTKSEPPQAKELARQVCAFVSGLSGRILKRKVAWLKLKPVALRQCRTLQSLVHTASRGLAHEVITCQVCLSGLSAVTAVQSKV